MHNLILWAIPLILLLAIILLISLGPISIPKPPVKSMEFPPNSQALFAKLDDQPKVQSVSTKDELSLFSTVLKHEREIKTENHTKRR